MSKISELSDGGSLVSTDFLIAVRSGGNVKVQMDTINVDQITLGDNEMIRLGNSQDLTMVHTSTQSIINQAGVGDLLIQKGAATKLTVNSSGIDVTGTATMDGLTVNSGTLDTVATFQSSDQFTDLELTDSGGTSYIRQSNGSLILEADRANASASSITLIKVDGAQVARFASGGDVSFYEDTGTTAKLVWDASAEMLTTSGLTANSGTSNVAATFASTDAYALIKFEDSATTTETTLGAYGNDMVFRVGAAETMRIVSGNLLVGKTGSSVSTDGVELTSTGFTRATVNGDTVLQLNRRTSDGTIVNFRKDGTTVGSISSRAGVALQVASATLSGLDMATDLNPMSNGSLSNGTVSLGNTGNRWKDLHLSDNVYAGQGFYGSRLWNTESTALRFATNNAEKMRIDSNGNLLVGKTATSFSLAGIGLMGNDQILATAASDNPLALNRLTTDGDIARFYKDSVQVGSIGVNDDKIIFGTANAAIAIDQSSNILFPYNPATPGARDAAIDLGYASGRFKDLYLSGDITSSRFTTDGDGIKMEAGKGIKFSGYASANVLDDYEEGEFTLVLSGTVAAGTNAGGSRGGFYTKIGRLVTCQIMVANTELTNATGVLKFSGLPFTPAGYASRGFRGVVSTYGQNLFSPADGYFSPAIDIVNGSTDFYLIQTKDDGNWANVLVDNQSGLYFEGCVSYFTND